MRTVAALRQDPLVRLLGLCRPQAGRLLLAVAAGVAAAGAAIGLAATSAWLIARASQHPPVLELMVAVVAVRAFGVGRGLFRYGERLLAHDAAFRVLAETRGRCYDALERLAPAGLPAFRRGDLLARFVDDVDAVPDVLARGLLPCAVAAVAGGGTVVLMWALLPAAGAVLLAGLLALAVAAPAAQAVLARRAEARIAPLRAETTAGTVDLLAGMDELVACGAAPARLAGLASTDARLARAEARSASAAGVSALLVGLAGGAVTWAALLLGSSAVSGGTLDPVLVAVVVLTPLAVFEVLADLPAAVRALVRSRTAAGRLFEVLDAPPPVPEAGTTLPAPDGRVPALRMAGVTAGWPGGPAVLHDVDLDLTPGRRVAVVGGSGSGKSTLVAVLMRFLDPTAGSVHLDGTDVRALAADDVRARIALCGQDPHIFDTTIAENLRVARPRASDGQLWAALRGAALDGWVAGLPRGLDTTVGEFGTALSGGQARRLALARALLRDARVLVLDEPTEHLDVAAADALTADLLAAAGERSVLLVTHRLTGLEGVDEIVVLADGRVAERGTHAGLLAADGTYARRWRAEREADA